MAARSTVWWKLFVLQLCCLAASARDLHFLESLEDSHAFDIDWQKHPSVEQYSGLPERSLSVIDEATLDLAAAVAEAGLDIAELGDEINEELARLPVVPDASAAGCRVYTYVEDVPSRKSQHDFKQQARLLTAAWKASWEAQGWRAQILTHADAAKHPKYAEWRKALSQLPTVNNKQYELACFMRWIAMASIGGGLMADFDVLNVGLKPMPGCQLPNNGNLTTHQNKVPCLVSGSASEYERMVASFAGINLEQEPAKTSFIRTRKHDGTPVMHVSDQDALHYFYTVRAANVSYHIDMNAAPPFITAPLKCTFRKKPVATVHYSHADMKKMGQKASTTREGLAYILRTTKMVMTQCRTSRTLADK
eukprot:jgi/Chlat1/7248/Chrsp58S00540